MISPTRRAVLIMAAGAPLALALGLIAPGLWSAGLAWILAVIGLIGLDALLAPSARSVTLDLQSPDHLPAAAQGGSAELGVAFQGRAPRRLEAALETNANLSAAPPRADVLVHGREARHAFALAPVRRGAGSIDRAWVRWTGPLGLTNLQLSHRFGRAVPVIPDVQAVRKAALSLFARDAYFGQKAQIERGDGTEFQALREFQPGMDLRTIDWKQSARHGQILSKEFRTERNHPIMLVIDSGRLMGEPVEGAPKLDRALNAALLLGYVGLRLGDRVGLCAFDSRPRLIGRPVTGTPAFPVLQRLATTVDYSTEETNFTLGLSTVLGALDRRALVVVFTDFADTTSAELMLESAARLTKRHLVLFALFTDTELEDLTRREPIEPADVSRAVVADILLQERKLVIAKLRRMGAEVIEAPAGRFGADLVDRYLGLKRRDRL